MPIEPTDAIQSIQRSLSLMPPAILAIVFLAGPTAAWLLYRYVVQPRSRRHAADGSDLLWICDQCRSANEVRSSRCYRCAMERDEITGALQVVDGDGIISLDPLVDEADPAVGPVGVPVMARAARSRKPVAVGPGPAPAAAPAPAPAPAPAAAPPPAVPDLSVALVGDGRRPPVPVGPGTDAAVVARRPRTVVAAGRVDAPDPTAKTSKRS